MKRLIKLAVIVLCLMGCQGPRSSPSTTQAKAMEIVSALCREKCTEFAWINDHGFKSVKGKTKKRYLPMEDLIREALVPYGWDIWIPMEDYFNGYDFRVGIKPQEPNPSQ